MKTATLTTILFLVAFGFSACGKKGDLEAPDKYKDTAEAQSQSAGN